MKQKSTLAKILSLILCLAMLIAMAPMIPLGAAVSATDPVVMAGSGTCGGAHSAMTVLTTAGMESYKVTYNSTVHFELPTGNYYLGEDIVLQYPLWVAGADSQIHIDLRGHTFRAKAGASYRAYHETYSTKTQLSAMVML